MLSGHPNIKRIRAQETNINGHMVQKLIVETNLNLSPERSSEDTAKLEKLRDFLGTVIGSEFSEVKTIEIRPFDRKELEEDDFGGNLVA